VTASEDGDVRAEVRTSPDHRFRFLARINCGERPCPDVGMRENYAAHRHDGVRLDSEGARKIEEHVPPDVGVLADVEVAIVAIGVVDDEWAVSNPSRDVGAKLIKGLADVSCLGEQPSVYALDAVETVAEP
jgi:hypothetical protein